MAPELNILVTNDDGYRSKGLDILTDMLRPMGRITSIAPKYHQSGMSMAVSMGCKAIAYRPLPADGLAFRAYIDATPASCVKYGLDNIMVDDRPDVVVCGINHGSNAATAANYSGTLGAAEEAALNGIIGIGVSLDTFRPDADFSAVQQYFPAIFRKLMDNRPERRGIFYNINFPDLPADRIRGVRVGHEGCGHWEREFQPWNLDQFSRRGIVPVEAGVPLDPPCEEGETLYMMVGDFVDDSPASDTLADHHLLQAGYISIVAHRVDNTDYDEIARLAATGFNEDFR